MTARIAEANQSKTGWWVAILLERFQPDGSEPADGTICEVWENEIIFTAKDRDDAYRKVTQYGKNGEGRSPVDIGGRCGKWVFEGLSSLLPIYDEFDDFSEIRWTRHRRALKTVRSWVRPREELECFQDD